MAIPKDILAVQRPSSTVVKQRGTRFVVVKRTSKRGGNRVVPVDIGTVGEIIDGRFVERKPEAPRKKRRVHNKAFLIFFFTFAIRNNKEKRKAIPKD